MVSCFLDLNGIFIHCLQTEKHLMGCAMTDKIKEKSHLGHFGISLVRGLNLAVKFDFKL